MKTRPETLAEIERLFKEYENEIEEAHKNGLLKENTVKTYLLHSGNFVRWCKDDFVPGERNTRGKH